MNKVVRELAAAAAAALSSWGKRLKMCKLDTETNSTTVQRGYALLHVVTESSHVSSIHSACVWGCELAEKLHVLIKHIFISNHPIQPL